MPKANSKEKNRKPDAKKPIPDLAANNELAAALMAAFDQLVEKVKARRPIGTDKKPAELGFVYSQLVQGMMINPFDYANPWNPAGATSVKAAVDKGTAPPKAKLALRKGVIAPKAVDAPADVSGDGSAPPAPDPKLARQMNAAFNTSKMVDRLIMVTKDGTYQEFPAGRNISSAYANILAGMQAAPPPPRDPAVDKRVEDARKILYVPDDEGDPTLKSKVYKAYEKNSRAYAQAVADYAEAQALASSNPAAMQVWPVKSKALRRAVDEAWDTLKAEGAEKVEAALNTLKAVGGTIDEAMIAKARKTFDLWNLGLAGSVPDDVPYAFCLPSAWPEYTNEDIGWMKIEVTRTEYEKHIGKDSHLFHDFKKQTSSSSTSGSGGGSFMGMGASSGYHRADAHEKDNTKDEKSLANFFKNDAKDITIKLQFGIVDIHRPFMDTNLFYLRNWYLVGNKKHCISDGTVNGQADSTDKLLPCLPVQFLVVRKVEIKAKSWGSDQKTMEKLFSKSGGAWDKKTSGFDASANVGIGFLSAKSNVSHEQAREGVTRYGNVEGTERKDYEARFEKDTLRIDGAQVVAFLSTILPACPPMDDPMLGKQASPELSTPEPAVASAR
jgi:hypothetical protein